jgi:aryl-alcohol dehydrogenase-like predicted oxidoreductase
MAQELGIGVLPWSPLRSGQLSGKYVRDYGTPADTRRGDLIEGPTERDWDVIEAVARVAAELGARRRSRSPGCAAGPRSPRR